MPPGGPTLSPAPRPSRVPQLRHRSTASITIPTTARQRRSRAPSVAPAASIGAGSWAAPAPAHEAAQPDVAAGHRPGPSLSARGARCSRVLRSRFTGTVMAAPPAPQPAAPPPPSAPRAPPPPPPFAPPVAASPARPPPASDRRSARPRRSRRHRCLPASRHGPAAAHAAEGNARTGPAAASWPMKCCSTSYTAGTRNSKIFAQRLLEFSAGKRRRGQIWARAPHARIPGERMMREGMTP